MTSIGGFSSASTTASVVPAHKHHGGGGKTNVADAFPVASDDPAQPATGLSASLLDPSKLAGLSTLLGADPAAVTSSAPSASDLVSALQNKGVDLNSLSSVLDSGDLLDVSA
jgi:hypothetical protein